MIAGARESVGDLRRGLRDALRVQAGSWAISTARELRWTRSFAKPRGAVRALQVAQAGNQLLALQSDTDRPDSDGQPSPRRTRAEALEAARTASAEAQGRENLRAIPRLRAAGLLPRHSYGAVRGE